MTVLHEILDTLAAIVAPGIATKFLDEQAEALCKLHGVRAAFKGYQPESFDCPGGYPAHICVSINNEVIHGIPSDRKIMEGDVVKIDLGTEKDGIYDDGATTVLVGHCSAAARKLVKATKEALEAGIAQAIHGNTTHDIARAIEFVAKKYDLHVVHGYGGHGIGTALHLEPHVPNEVAGTEPPVELKAGMRLAIEPMFAVNHGFTHVAKNGWTVKLRNGGLAAHFERTVTVNQNRPAIPPLAEG